LIEEVLRDINNFFVSFRDEGHNIESKKVTVDNPDKFLVGQYILIKGSRLSDGVYEISNIAQGQLLLTEEVEGDLEDETDDFYVYGLKIPKNVIHIHDDIMTFYNDSVKGIDSESLGDYSVKYTSDGKGDTTWKTAFASRLNPYRQMYLDLDSNLDL